MQYKVLREHIGDKFYKAGDVRDADEHSVVHLVRKGVLVPISSVPAAELVGDHGSDQNNLSNDGVAQINTTNSNIDQPEDSAGADENSGEAQQGVQKPEGDIAMNNQADQVKKDVDHKNKAGPAAPKNKGA